MQTLIFLIDLAFSIYYLLILARVILSYMPHNRFHPLIAPVYTLTEPILSPIRQGLPPMRIGLDASPFVVIILLWLLQRIILEILKLL
ncbi:MAG: YggT family protein [Candidatus Saganbacteria bacterium]|nr:YggT family protein [Candidatus Saganbacteria bacterium]